MTLDRIGELGSIIYDRHQVIAEIGNFSIEDASALMTMDAGAVVHPTFTIPHPEYARHLDAYGKDNLAGRQALLQLVHDTDHIDTVAAQLTRKIVDLVQYMPVVRVLPVHSPSVIIDGKAEELYTDANDKLPTSSWVFLDQQEVMSPEAMRQLTDLTLAVISRFVAPGESRECRLKFPWGDVDYLPCADKLNSRAQSAIPLIAAKLTDDLEGTALDQRVNSSQAAMLFALKRLEFYGNNFTNFIEGIKGFKFQNGLTDIDQIGGVNIREASWMWAAFLFKMKLFLEAIIDAGEVLKVKMSFAQGLDRGSRQFEILQHNLNAAHGINSLYASYFRWHPYAQRYRVESAQGRFVITGRPIYMRTQYPKTDGYPIQLGQYSASMFIPDGTLEWAPTLEPNTYYRSTREIGRMALGIDVPYYVHPESVDQARDAINDLMTIISDRLSARYYMQGNDKAVQKAVPRGLVPLSARILRNAGQIDAEELVPGYSISLLSDDNVKVNGSVAIPWHDQSPFREAVSYRVPIIPYSLPGPFIIR